MKSALLFYRKLVGELCDMGFEINPYDPCEANNMVNGSQITVCWHIDDLMISHVDSNVINELLRTIKGIYGENLAKKTGNVHDYLGMAFDYATSGEVRVNMRQYLDKVIT